MAGKKNEAYIEFKANTSEFQKGIKQMNAELKNASNALRLNATELKGAGDSVDLLSERQNILQTELDASKKKVELTEKSLAECKATLGENSKEYASLSNAVLAAKNQQQAIQNELEQTAAKLEKIETENKEAATAFGQLTDKIEAQESDLAALKKQYANVVLEQGKGSKEAKKLSKQIGSLSEELDDNKKELKYAEAAADKFDETLDELTDSAKDAGDGFTVLKGAAANLISTGFTGLVNGAKSAVTGIMGLEEETREYRAEMGKLDTSFATNGHSIDTAKAAYSELYGIIGETDQSVEAAQQISLLAKSEEEVAQWAGYAAGVVGVFGDALQPETFYESANETLKLGEATGAYTQMLEGCGVNVEKFNEGLAACKTESEKQAYMLETTESLLGEASKKYRETNADIIAANKSNADYSDTMAKFGEKVEPVTSAVKEGFNGLLQEVLGLVEGVDVAGFASAIESGFGVVKDTVLPAVVEGFSKLKEAWQWLNENQGVVVALASVIGVLTAAITAYNTVQAIKAAMAAAEVPTVWALVSAQLAHAAAAIAAVAPYVLIAAAIGAIIAVIVLCVKHWDEIKAKITEVAKKVKEKVIEIKNQITEKINAAKQKAVEIFENIKKSITDKITALRTKVTEIFNKIKEKILTPINNAKEKVVGTIENLKSSFTSKVEAIKSKVTNVFNTIKEKITKPVEQAREKVKGIVDKIKGFFNFKLSLPKLKIPKFSVSPAGWKVGDLLKGSIPKLSVKWNAKGGVFTKPTVLQGFGEAGTEYALPLNERSLTPLATMLNKLTLSGGNGLADVLASRFDAAITRLENRLAHLEANFYLDGERVATATATYNDTNSGERALLIERGLAVE